MSPQNLDIVGMQESLKKAPLRLESFTPEQIEKLDRKLAAQTEWRPDGCRVALPGSGGVLMTPVGRALTFAHYAWMKAHGETPKYRMRTTCRVVGCCNVEHLQDAPPRVKSQFRIGRKMNADEKALALKLYRQDRLRMQDIADQVGVAVQTIHKLVTRSPA